VTTARTPSKTPRSILVRIDSRAFLAGGKSALIVSGHRQIDKPSASPRHVLPRDLPAAVKHLDDRELDRLLSVVLAEQRVRRRRVRVPDEGSRKRRVKEVAPITLTRDQINAVRAAFKAGVTPARIARQFGLSQSDERTIAE